MANFPFMGYKEYLRIYSIQHVTTNGIYKEDQVPTEYIGANLTVEVVHQVVMVSPNGELFKFDYDVPEALDEDGNKSGGIELDGTMVTAGTNPTEQRTRVTELLDEDLKEAADAMYEVAQLSREG